MSTEVTKKDLTDLKENLEESLKKGLAGLKENLEETYKEGVRDLVQHFNDSQEVQNNQLKQISADLLQVNVKLDAIMSGRSPCYPQTA